MKWIIMSICLLMAVPSLAKNSDAEVLTSLTSYLDFGVYVGENETQNKCVVVVSELEKPPQKTSNSQYMVEIFSNGQYGWYAFITNRTMGGRGDCANVEYDNGSFLKIQNSGPAAPCFSNPKKSTDKGLQIVDLKDGSQEVMTLNAAGSEEAVCHLPPAS